MAGGNTEDNESPRNLNNEKDDEGTKSGFVNARNYSESKNPIRNTSTGTRTKCIWEVKINMLN